MPLNSHKIVLALALVGLSAQAAADDGLMDLSLEDLVDIQVFSVSRKAQRLGDTAAAVTVLTHEDIRRSGARSVPEALRLVPGVQVAQIGAGRWAVSVRGFNSRFASKLLVQIDGRSMYSPMFSGVFWNALNLMMEDVERIEVVRGPGASLWGANAVNGVINIVTRNAASTTGSMVRASVDDRGNPEVAVRQGLTLTGGAALRVYALSENRAPFETRGGASSQDEQTGWRTGFRLDSEVGEPDRWMVSGEAYRQRSPEVLELGPLGSNYTPFDFEGAHVLARRDWASSAGQASLRAYFDYADVGLGALAGATVHTGDLDFQHRLPITGAHEWIWGVGLRHQSIAVKSRVPVITFDKRETQQQTFSAFVQDEVVLMPRRLRLTLGARFEARNMGTPEFQPTVRLLWSPSDRDSVWTRWSRAARTPSYGERYAGLAVGVRAFPPFPAATLISLPEEDLRSESVNAFELGYRRQLDRGSVEAVLFRQRYSHLVGSRFGGFRMPGLIPPTPDVLLTRHNGGSAVSEGAELGGEMAVSQDLRLGVAYTVMRHNYDATGDAILDSGNATIANRNANHWLSLQARIDLSSRQELDLQVRHVGALKGQPAPGVDAYTVMDARYGYRFSRRTELTLSVTNLLDTRYSAYSSDYFPSAYAYDRRRFLLTGRWTF